MNASHSYAVTARSGAPGQNVPVLLSQLGAHTDAPFMWPLLGGNGKSMILVVKWNDTALEGHTSDASRPAHGCPRARHHLAPTSNYGGGKTFIDRTKSRRLSGMNGYFQSATDSDDESKGRYFHE